MSVSKRRVDSEPAYILHSYDWSESSLVLEVFTRHYGRRVILAKGVKRPLSGFRSALLPLQRIVIGFSSAQSQDAEVATLKSAQWGGGSPMPQGEHLLGGVYMNELLLRLLAREDAHPTLFDFYDLLVLRLSGLCAMGQKVEDSTTPTESAASILRAFELLLLFEVGLLPALDCELSQGHSLDSHKRYRLEPSVGLRGLELEEDAASNGELTGDEWMVLSHALSAVCLPTKSSLHPESMAVDNAAMQYLINTIQSLPSHKLRVQLRHNLNAHTGHAPLRTRQFFAQIQSV